MRSLPRVSGSACVAALTWAGLALKWQKGRHHFLHHPETGAVVTVPDLPELDSATLRAIIHTAGLTVDEFCERL